jgi:manganese/zinc/iron transport system substrate-binding protein
MNRIPLFLFFFFVPLFWSCQDSPTKNERFKIVTTTGHIADMLRNVVGDRADVTALMGPGVDPHLYKASLSDLKELSSADLIFYSGLHLEGKMGEVFHKLRRTKHVVAVTDGIPRHLLLMADEENHIPDPHIWFDVNLWRYCLEEVVAAMSKFDPKNKEEYKRKALIYDKQLEELNETVLKDIHSIPQQQRVLVTPHDAFGYFGRAYGIEVIGLQGISTLSEYGLNEITHLTKLLTERQIPSIFMETSVSEKAIHSVIEGCRQKGHEVKIGGSLYSDALGDPKTAEGTYIGMFKYNVHLIKKGLYR